MKKTIALMAGVALCAFSRADHDFGQSQKDLGKLSIDDLMNIEVTTASKSAEKLNEVPAAIYVVTADQIRRSGANSIPDALRSVPGVQVAQISTTMWSISIRGFNSRYADKLLVLIDGRSVYTPTFSGVYWDAQEVNMEDIDRIEVIRGPGGSLWGANAVNGIVNVITKSAADTQGGTLNVGTSSAQPALDTVRYGGKFGPTAFYRVYAKLLEVKGLTTHFGTPGNDGWQALRGGIRTDWTSKNDVFTMSAGVNSAHEAQTDSFPTFAPPFTILATDHYAASNWNLGARWDRSAGSMKGASLQVYVDHTERNAPETGEKRDNFNADFQCPVSVSPANRLTWGLGYHTTKDNLQPTAYVTYSPMRRTDSVFSGFLHDEWTLDRGLKLTLGAKAEHNGYTGWEVQPSARLAYTRNPRQTFWASVSRAVRTPSRADVNSLIHDIVGRQGGQLTEVTIQGNPNFESETVVAHEIGWRVMPSDRLSIDLTAYHNLYNNLRSYEPLAPYFSLNPVPHVVAPFRFGNGLNARTAGIEVAAQYQATQNWKVDASYTIYSERYRFNAGVMDLTGPSGPERQGTTPRSQLSVRSTLDLPHRLQFDTSLYYIDRLAGVGIPAYARLDLRLGWKPNDRLEVSVGAQNLLTKRHLESFSTLFEVQSFVERSFFAGVSVKF